MNWVETGIVLNSKLYSESARLVTVFNKSIGKTSALLKTKKSPIQTGDIAQVTWQGKKIDSLGTFIIEDIFSPFVFSMNEQGKIYAIESACTLCNLGLPDKAPHEKLFDVLHRFLLSLSQENWLRNYIFFELTFLSEIGFGLNLSACAVTGRKDIYYLSPKTGRGVVKEVGEKYKDKLFIIPKFLLDYGENPSYKDIYLAMRITTHFLKTYLYDISGKELPLSRNYLANICSRNQEA